MANKKYHVFYMTPGSFGEITITQREYAPITGETLEDARRIIREHTGLSENTKIVIVSWQRYEEE